VPLKRNQASGSTALLAMTAAFVLAVGCDSADSEAPPGFPLPEGAGGSPGATKPPSRTKPPEPLVTADSPCPGWVPPAPNTTCDVAIGLVRGWDGTCEYGHDLDSRCNDTAVCSGFWTLRPRDSKCLDPCPESFGGIVAGAECDNTAKGCSYVEGTCACVEQRGDGADAGVRKRWRCVPPPANGCPAQRPALRSDCVRPMTCDYGSCSLQRDLSFQCLQNVWIQADSPFCQEP
jgi:hypothetical protein